MARVCGSELPAGAPVDATATSLADSSSSLRSFTVGSHPGGRCKRLSSRALPLVVTLVRLPSVQLLSSVRLMPAAVQVNRGSLGLARVPQAQIGYNTRQLTRPPQSTSRVVSQTSFSGDGHEGARVRPRDSPKRIFDSLL